jgi:gephyrin
MLHLPQTYAVWAEAGVAELLLAMAAPPRALHAWAVLTGAWRENHRIESSWTLYSHRIVTLNHHIESSHWIITLNHHIESSHRSSHRIIASNHRIESSHWIITSNHRIESSHWIIALNHRGRTTRIESSHWIIALNHRGRTTRIESSHCIVTLNHRIESSHRIITSNHRIESSHRIIVDALLASNHHIESSHRIIALNHHIESSWTHYSHWIIASNHHIESSWTHNSHRIVTLNHHIESSWTLFAFMQSIITWTINSSSHHCGNVLHRCMNSCIHQTTFWPLQLLIHIACSEWPVRCRHCKRSQRPRHHLCCPPIAARPHLPPFAKWVWQRCSAPPPPLADNPSPQTGPVTAIVPDERAAISAWITERIDRDGCALVFTTGGTGFAVRDVTPEVGSAVDDSASLARPQRCFARRRLWTLSIVKRQASLRCDSRAGHVSRGFSVWLGCRRQFILVKSLEKTPMAALSRAVCGMRGKSIILNLPGSPRGAAECVSFAAPLLVHALQLLDNPRQPAVEAAHASLAASSSLSPPASSSKCQHHHHHDHSHRHAETPGVVVAAPALPPVTLRARVSPFPMISMAEAYRIIHQFVHPLAVRLVPAVVCASSSAPTDSRWGDAVQDVEECSLSNALGRVAAERVCAREPLPPFRASVKDGYAVRSADGCGTFPVVYPLTAGDAPGSSMPTRSIVRVNTGGPVPDDADAVVQVEDTALIEASADNSREILVEIKKAAAHPGQDVRAVGSDIAAGEAVLERGSLIGAAEIGLLATVGVGVVSVLRKPRIAVMSTGNELVDMAAELPPGKIRDANRYTLLSAVQEYGGERIDAGIVGDTFEELVQRMQSLLAHSPPVDMVLTTGGVSMGEKDLVRQALEAVGGQVHFARVNMKPGKPTTFATWSKVDAPATPRAPLLFFALPGNPVSAHVTFLLHVVPVLRGMLGLDRGWLTVRARLTEAASLDLRPEYVRARLELRGGEVWAAATGSQCSSRLASMRSASALLVLPGRTPELPQLSAGTEVDALLLRGAIL